MSRLPSRPKPPSFQEIIADLETAKDNDVLFELVRRNADAESGAGDAERGTGGSRGGTPVGGRDSEDGPGASGRPTSADTSSSGESGTGDQSYQKAEHFLAVMKELEDSPQKLDGEVQKLERLGEEVSEVIESLKASAGSSYIH